MDTMTDHKQKHGQTPLSTKIFRTVLVFSAALLFMSALFGLILFNYSNQKAYARAALMMAQKLRDFYPGYVQDELVPEMIRIYEETPAEIAADPYSEEYLSRFDHLDTDERLIDIEMKMLDLENSEGAAGLYITVYDIVEERLIWAADSRNDEDYIQTGLYRDIEAGKFFRSFSDETVDDIPYLVFNTLRYGSTLTCWDILNTAGVGRYYICAMAELDMNMLARQSVFFLLQYASVILLLTFVLGYFIVQNFQKTVVRPLNEMAKAAKAYAKNQVDGSSDQSAFGSLNIETGDEIEELSETLKNMEKEKDQNVRSLMELTAEKEKIRSELSVAAEIQKDALPSRFPPFPERHEFEIFASMEPAREVGGDFYDFALLDQDHLMLVIADVSGKGIPGALYMMTCKTLIRNLTDLYLDDPAMILEKMNDQLSENNSAGVFVTVWVGILEISTGRLYCSNAGHEYPVLRRGSGRYKLLQDQHGLVVGALEGSKYTTYEIDLSEGDTVYVYTDGVPEAIDAERHQYGTDRLIRALNESGASDCEELLAAVSRDIASFTGDVERFDDITMLAFRYFGCENKE
ncbi:MAG: PP2C family protein-serine/threonine phosphatase [Solobacterium sp.]|nr:PP2C family protein-serine/threonine phosphatase [Solobacterium sp.]